MVKSKTGKKTKKAVPTKKSVKGQTKPAEYVQYLLELHKLQGTLLVKLQKEL